MGSSGLAAGLLDACISAAGYFAAGLLIACISAAGYVAAGLRIIGSFIAGVAAGLLIYSYFVGFVVAGLLIIGLLDFCSRSRDYGLCFIVLFFGRYFVLDSCPPSTASLRPPWVGCFVLNFC
ncbi:hypothetical protein ILYODFUR_037949 [Ilyodon furcidens]|uniref:NADH dehydrogenase subunit 6 n=1 Tax=Ilyodon furcidens TaxID=33524 RepID=A0ABV0UPP2_9TELE